MSQLSVAELISAARRTVGDTGQGRPATIRDERLGGVDGTNKRFSLLWYPVVASSLTLRLAGAALPGASSFFRELVDGLTDGNVNGQNGWATGPNNTGGTMNVTTPGTPIDGAKVLSLDHAAGAVLEYLKPLDENRAEPYLLRLKVRPKAGRASRAVIRAMTSATDPSVVAFQLLVRANGALDVVDDGGTHSAVTTLADGAVAILEAFVNPSGVLTLAVGGITVFTGAIIAGQDTLKNVCIQGLNDSGNVNEVGFLELDTITVTSGAFAYIVDEDEGEVVMTTAPSAGPPMARLEASYRFLWFPDEAYEEFLCQGATTAGFPPTGASLADRVANVATFYPDTLQDSLLQYVGYHYNIRRADEYAHRFSASAGGQSVSVDVVTKNFRDLAKNFMDQGNALRDAFYARRGAAKAPAAAVGKYEPTPSVLGTFGSPKR